MVYYNKFLLCFVRFNVSIERYIGDGISSGDGDSSGNDRDADVEKICGD